MQPPDIEENYDVLEKKMLKEFYELVDRQRHCIWLHWNMRDINYGFAALAHRYKVLGGSPIEIPEAQLVDLARLITNLFGVGYIADPRLANLVRKNKIGDLGFLTGQEEAKAFEEREYVKLHQSTLRKVDILADIAERTLDGTLKTDATRKDTYGSEFAYWGELIREHWLFGVFALVGSIASIISLLLFFASQNPG